jgi:hypothetical protein
MSPPSEPPKMDPARARAMFEAMALAFAGNAPTFEEFEQQQPKLVTELAAFDPQTSVSIVAGLLTYPQFHANTIRLEVLQHLVQRNATGKTRPTRNNVNRWLSKYLSEGYAWLAEDPPEDVFISNVVSHLGNARIFEGIWEANDFWLQQALNAVRQLDQNAELEAVLSESLALLQLSEMLAERCRLERYCAGAGSNRHTLILPTQRELYARSELVRFSRGQLQSANVNVDRLGPFVHDEAKAQGAPGKSSLERCPLVKYGKNYIVALPAAISPAIRKHIVDAMIRLALVEKFDKYLSVGQCAGLFNEGVGSLGGEPISPNQLPLLPVGTPASVQELYEFDTGKFAHLLFCEDSSLEFAESGLVGILQLNEQQSGVFVNHLKSCAEAIAARHGYQGGLTIVIVGGLGRAFAIPFPKFPERWYVDVFRLPDFLALGRVEDWTLLRLWKLKNQMHDIQQRGLVLHCPNGDLNLIGYWEHNGYRLVSREMPLSPGHVLGVGTDFIATVRKKLRTAHDIHAVRRRNPNVWRFVRRYTARAYFKELEDDPVYVDLDDAMKSKLRGIAETSRRPWWLSVVQELSPRWQKDIQYRIWEAMLSWMLGISSLAERSFSSLPSGPIEFFLEFDGFENWHSQQTETMPNVEDTLMFATDARNATVSVRIPVSFIKQFENPRNIAERRLVGVFFSAIAELARCTLTVGDMQRLIQEVVKNDDARFFHIMNARDYRQLVDEFESGIQPRFVQEGDLNFAALDICWRVRDRSVGDKIVGLNNCNGFLHAVVDEYWGSLRGRLSNINKASLIRRCLENSESIECDKERWRLTAAALLASHEDREDVVRAARERDTLRNRSAIASRVLVEMAACNSPATGGETISTGTLEVLMAEVNLLLYAAHCSDALKYELTGPEISLFPNGEFDLDNSYQKNIVHPYVSGSFAEEFNRAAADYSSLFEDPRREGEGDAASSFPEAFTAAFTTEFGFHPEDLIQAVVAIEDDGIKQQKLVIERTRTQYLEILGIAGISAEIADYILKHFALWPRRAWNETPDGFAAKDWQPWRFRRRLSLIARPIVLLGQGEDLNLMYAPGMVADCVQRQVVRAMTGEFPPEYFQTSVMRSWVGTAVMKRGGDFEEEVAEAFRKLGLHARAKISMTEFGADQSFGDLDVLAWDAAKGVFFTVECKRLRFARTVGEIGEQLRTFKGEEKDRLAKHLRRVAWFEAHPESLCQVSREKIVKPRIVPFLVTNTFVPMQFVEGLPLPPRQVVPVIQLAAAVRDWSR